MPNMLLMDLTYIEVREWALVVVSDRYVQMWIVPGLGLQTPAI